MDRLVIKTWAHEVILVYQHQMTIANCVLERQNIAVVVVDDVDVWTLHGMSDNVILHVTLARNNKNAITQY